MDISLLFAAFIAGLITFFAPCTLPLVPGYLVFVSGASLQDVHRKAPSCSARKKILLNGLLFVAGFSAVFVLFGMAAGAFGSFLFASKAIVAQIGGVVVIIFGLFMLDAIDLPFLRYTRQFAIPTVFHRGRLRNSFALGVIFGCGWTPCVGPVLGSVLLLASSEGTAWQGAFLLSVFSLGLAIPFMMIAVMIGSATRIVHALRPFSRLLTIGGGAFLILLGVLMLMNSVGYAHIFMSQWFEYDIMTRWMPYL